MEAPYIVQSHSRSDVNPVTKLQAPHHRGDNIFKPFSNEILPFVFLRKVGVYSPSEVTQFVGRRLAGPPLSESLSNDRREFRIFPRLREGAASVGRSLALVGGAPTNYRARCKVLYCLTEEPVDHFCQDRWRHTKFCGNPVVKREGSRVPSAARLRLIRFVTVCQ